MTRTRKVLLMLLALALLKRPVDALLANLLPDAVLVNAVAGAMVSLLLLGIPAWHLRPWTSPRLVQRKSLWEGMGLSVLMAVLVRFGTVPLDAAWQGFLGIAPEALPAPESLPAAMLYVLTLAVIPSIIEEMYFRGALLTGLLDGSRRVTAVLLTTPAFALMHGNAANLPSLLAASLMLTLLMLHTGRIGAPAAAHLVYNLLAFVPVRLPLWGSGLACAAMIVLAVRMIFRWPKIAHPPMKRADGLIAGAALAVLAMLYFV